MATAWEILIQNSTIDDNGINTAWDHLNNQGGTSTTIVYDKLEIELVDIMYEIEFVDDSLEIEITEDVIGIELIEDNIDVEVTE